jgi:hypothetical protein
MSKLICFSITVELNEDTEATQEDLNKALSEMENLCGLRSWDLYDSEIIEEDILV